MHLSHRNVKHGSDENEYSKEAGQGANECLLITFIEGIEPAECARKQRDKRAQARNEKCAEESLKANLEIEPERAPRQAQRAECLSECTWRSAESIGTIQTRSHALLDERSGSNDRPIIAQ